MKIVFNTKTPDEQLINGCKAGDRLAQRYLYEKYFSPLMAKALRYMRNDREQALDVLNRSFLKIYKSLAEFRGENFPAWASRIVIYTAIDSIRSQTNYQENTSFAPLNTNEEPLQTADVMDVLNMNDLLKLVNQLSTATRTVFVMQAIDGYKQTEIANLLGISENTVKWHYATAKEQLRLKLSAQ